MALRVLVLRGGPGADHEFSMRSGKFVLDNINKEKYHPLDVVINHAGEWYHAGKLVSPEQIFAHTDTVFNTVHGAHGEDGTLAQLFHTFNMPHTSSASLAASLSHKKILAKRKAEELGIPTPKHTEILSNNIASEGQLEKKATEILRTYHLPIVIKPSHGGTSIGVTIAKSFHDLIDGMREAALYAPSILIEEYIQGKELNVSVFRNMRDEALYTPPAIHISYNNGSHFDRSHKHTGNFEIHAPAVVEDEHKNLAEKYAKLVHDALNLNHISQSDFIVHPKRGIFYIETNSIPLLDNHSPLIKSAETVGISPSQVIDHLIKQSLVNTHHLVG